MSSTGDISRIVFIISELGPVISEIGTFHDRPTYSSVDTPLTHRRYGMPEEETYYEPVSTSYGSYGRVWYAHT